MNNFEERTQWDGTVTVEDQEPQPATAMEHMNYFFFGATDIALSEGLFYYGILGTGIGSLLMILIAVLSTWMV